MAAVESSAPRPPARVPTRDRLLSAAREHLDEHGLEGLSLREVARRAGVSHGAPLRHFSGVATLMSAVAAEGFRDLMRFVGDAVDRGGPSAAPSTRLRAAGEAYARFAFANPGVFGLMFRPELYDRGDAELLDAGAASFGQLCDLVAALQATGYRASEPTTRLAGVVWASVHGLTQLAIQGALQGATGDDDLDAFAELIYSLLLPPTEPARRHRR